MPKRPITPMKFGQRGERIHVTHLCRLASVTTPPCTLAGDAAV